MQVKYQACSFNGLLQKVGAFRETDNVNQLYCFKLTITYKACMMIAVLVSRNNTPF